MMRLRAKRYREKYPERVKEAKRKTGLVWREKNPGKVAEYAAKWGPVYAEKRRVAAEAKRLEREAYLLEHGPRLAAERAEKKRVMRAKGRERNREKRRAGKRALEKRKTALRRYIVYLWIWANPSEVSKYREEIALRLARRKRIKRQNRRARERNANGRLSQGLFARLFALQKRRCAACRDVTPKGMHLDHIVPLAGGGTNEDTNIQLLCPECNFDKRARDPVEFMQSRGMLL